MDLIGKDAAIKHDPVSLNSKNPNLFWVFRVANMVGVSVNLGPNYGNFPDGAGTKILTCPKSRNFSNIVSFNMIVQ